MIVATGVTPRIPELDGIDHPKVATYADVLAGRVVPGAKVAVIGAGGIGVDVSHWLTHDPQDTTEDWMAHWGVGDPSLHPGGLTERKPRTPVREVTLVQRKTTPIGIALGKTSGWQPDEREPEEGWRREHRKAESPQGRRFRSCLCGPRGHLPRERAGSDRQDADPECAERRVEGAAREGAAGLRRAPRACEEAAIATGQERWLTAADSRSLVHSCSRACYRRVRRLKTHTVIVEAMRFMPQTLTVQRGDRVVWVNKDLFPHTATATAGSFDSGSIAANTSWAYVARDPGRHAYLCSLHTTMTGELTIQ